MIDFKIEKIVPLCEEFGVTITDEMKEKLNLYGNLLLEWNEKINLTAITEPEDVLFKHFYGHYSTPGVTNALQKACKRKQRQKNLPLSVYFSN